MEFTMFNTASLAELALFRILNTNGNKYSDEEVQKIVVYALAELQVKHEEDQKRKGFSTKTAASKDLDDIVDQRFR